MLEVTDRWGLAKTAIWTIKDKTICTPVILDIIEEEDVLYLSDEEDFRIKVPRSFFQPKINGSSIPATFGYTSTAGGELVESRGGSPEIQVIYNQEPDPDAELYILANSPELISRGNNMVDRIIELRKKIPFHKLIYTPGIALPNNISFLSYLGVDVFDMVYPEYLSTNSIEVSDWMGFPGNPNNNRRHMQDEIRLIREGIVRGRIRELVESRVRTEPWLVEALRYMDDKHDLINPYIPVTGDKVLVTTRESFYRPDIVRFRERLWNTYQPPERDVLLLLPCSARKPYFTSNSHRRFRSATNNSDWTNVHEVILTSPLGMVPRELELFYPAQNYDMPVTHTWYEEERKTILDLVDMLIEKGNYQTVISHLPHDMDFVKEHIECEDTTQGEHPTDEIALKRLTGLINESAGQNRGDVKAYLKENLSSFARFQFGPDGHHLLDHAEVKGRYPEYKIMSDKQIGMMVAQRGLLSLTLDGGKILNRYGINLVEIEDFVPKGTVFAVGVTDADERISPGDECIVIHDGKLRGVGVAEMAGKEMIDAKRGVAVNIRHHTKR